MAGNSEVSRERLKRYGFPLVVVAAIGAVAAFGADGDSTYPKGFEPGGNLVVIGDSIASGVGTDTSFGKIIGRNFGMAVENAAWSGADFEQILYGDETRASQLDALRDTTSAVIVTAGGNEAGGDEADIRELFETCEETDCSKGSPLYEQVRAQLDSENMVDKYEELLGAIAQQAPHAEIYLTGYSPPVNKGALGTVACLFTACEFMEDGRLDLLVDSTSWANRSAATAVERIDSDRIHYAEAGNIGLLSDADILSRLAGGGALVFEHGEWILHLTEEGHQRIANELVADLANRGK